MKIAKIPIRFVAGMLVTLLTLPCGLATWPVVADGRTEETSLQGGANAEGSADSLPLVAWQTDYGAAMAAAEREAAMMVVYFRAEGSDSCDRFQEAAGADAELASRLAAAQCVRLPMDAEITARGERLRLIDHPAFRDLGGQPGLAILDFTSRDASAHGRVARTVVFSDGARFDPDELRVLPQRVESAAEAGTVRWLTDYATAVHQAELERRMLLIYFHRADGQGGCRQFQAETLSNNDVRCGLKEFVTLKLPHDAKVALANSTTAILKHPSFAEMLGLPGVAIVDYSDPDAAHYGQVVSVFPFLRGRPYTPAEMRVILELPPGKLTQRTLIYAVRTHPERPQSASGELDAALAAEAENHSRHQATIRSQGHHAWETRFHRINRLLPFGFRATEVCAESWPGEGLLEAAIECVRSWRQSSGHWNSVRTHHPVFGYDMRRGANGIWYATGIFGNRGR